MSARKVLLTLFVALVVVGSTVPAGLAQELSRHEDPAVFQSEQPDLVLLEKLYGLIYNSTVGEEFVLAVKWLGVAGLVYGPSATKVAMGEFTTSFGSVVQDLNQTRVDISVIRGYIRHLRIAEAKAAISVALARLDVANATVGSMDVEAVGLGSMLKGSPEAMLVGDQKLRDLIEKYRLILLGLLKLQEGLSNLMVSSGSITLFNGTILINNVPLPNGTILINNITLSNGTILINNVTLPNGTILINNITLSNGTILPIGTVLPNGLTLPIGTVLPNGLTLPIGTVLPNGLTLPIGTVLPNGLTLLNGTILTDVKFVHTKLLISVIPTEALVGSSVYALGNLTDSSGVGLAGRRVGVYVDGALAETVVTDASGSFAVSLGVPYVYKDHVTVSAEYSGEYSGGAIYLPCASNDVVVKLIYYTPVLSVVLPGEVYPGKSFDVAGAALVDGVGVGGLAVEVSAFNSAVRLVSDDSGRFSASIPVPSDSAEGLAGVGIYSSPRGVYGPSSFVGYVDVVRVPLTLSVDSSSWAVSGFPLGVSGSVLLDGVPVGNCTVRLGGSVGDSVVSTGVNGRFESEVGLPFTLLTSDYSFRVRVYASVPWASDASVGREVFVVNVVTMVVGAIVACVGVYFGYRWYKRRPKRRVVAPPQPIEDGPVPVPVAVAGVEGAPLGAREVYGSAVEIVVRTTGVSPRPSMTLREYLGATREKLGAGERIFRSLTLMFERWLYGGAEVRVGVMDRLLRRIRTLFS